MKIKALLLASFATIFVLLGGYWLYHTYYLQDSYPLEALVPPDAVAVYSGSQPELALDSLRQHPVGEILGDLPAVQRLKAYRLTLDSLLPAFKQLQPRNMLVSLHITQRHDFDFLLFMPLQGTSDEQLLREFKQQLSARPDLYRISERSYQEVQITDVRFLNNKQTFSFFVEKGVLAGSFTSFLTEAAIRQRAELGEATAAQVLEKVPAWLKKGNVAAIADSWGNLSLNLQQLPAMLRVFTASDSLVQDVLAPMPYFSKLDLIPAPEGLFLNGFTQAVQAEEADFLWALQGQLPQPMRLHYLVPQRSASLMFVGLSDVARWHKRLLTSWQKKSPLQWERWQVLLYKVPEAEALLSYFDKEVGLVTVPAPGAANADRLLLVHLTDSGSVADVLQKLSTRLATKDSLNLYAEQFMQQKLQELPYQEFPAALLGSSFLGFQESYYTVFEDYLVISSSIPALKDLLLDVQAEETWQRSLRLNNFLSRLDAEQNWSYFLNMQSLWPMLNKALAPSWRTFLEREGLGLRQFDLLSLQLSSTNDGFYTNAFLHLNQRPEQQLEQLELVKKSATQMPAPLVHAPVPVPYRLQRSGYWLVQDSTRTLYLLTNSGEVQMTTRLGGYWQNQLAVLDPQKNKSAHYFFTTPDSAYLLQPNLKPLKPFPLSLGTNERIQWSAVLDYDNSQRYRILLASEKGKLFMYDLDGVLLDGWRPVSLKGALSAAPGHVRVRSKDVVYAFELSGQVHAFSRRGEYMPGFPLSLGDSLLGPVHVQQGSDFKSTRFITVTASGVYVEWDLEGKVLARRQLYRPDSRARFFLVPDVQGKRFLIAEQDKHRLRLLNEQGDDLFEKEYLGAAQATAGSMDVQYFSFANADALLAVTDREQEFTYLYDLKGNLLQAQPLNSCCPLGLQLSATGDSLRLVKAYGHALEQYQLPAVISSK